MRLRTRTLRCQDKSLKLWPASICGEWWSRFIKHARGNFVKEGGIRPCWRLGEFFCGKIRRLYSPRFTNEKIAGSPPVINIDQAVIYHVGQRAWHNSNLLDRFLVLLEHKGHSSYRLFQNGLAEDGEKEQKFSTISCCGYDFVTVRRRSSYSVDRQSDGLYGASRLKSNSP